MNELNEQVRRIGGLDCHIVPTDKFKTNTILLLFKSDLDKQTVTKRAILSYVLKNASRKYPTQQLLQARLDDLYGAALSSGLSKRGDQHVVSFSLTVAGERFLSDRTPLLHEALQLLSELIFHPLAGGRTFDEAAVEREKRALRQRIESVFDDKMRYASQRLIDEMCKDEVYHLHTYGYEGEVEGITAGALYQYYLDFLKNDKVDLYVVGQVDAEAVFRQVRDDFAFEERPSGGRPRAAAGIVPAEVRVVEERQPVQQGKLNLGFRTSVVMGDRLYDASQVFNGLFGGFPHSKLFMNVREKASLAYYASSSYESYKGFVIVMSGIEFSNYDQAVRIIKDQLKAMQDGDFTDREVDLTKSLLKNAILETLDNPHAIINILYQRVLSGESRTIEDWLKHVDSVTKEEIIEVAGKTRLDTIFFLQGEAVA